MMVRLNKTKPEDYMRPLDVPGGRKQTPMSARLNKPVSRVQIPAGAYTYSLVGVVFCGDACF
jgi:hypothetical protein